MREATQSTSIEVSLPIRLPPESAFVSLSHAISWVAFRHSMPSQELSEFLGYGGWGRPEAYGDEALDDAINNVVQRLTDLGRTGVIGFQGRFFPHLLTDEYHCPTESIPPERLADFVCFDPLDDALYWPSRDDINRGRHRLAWGKDRRESHYPRNEEHYRYITVSRNDLIKEFPLEPTDISQFSISEVDAWINSTPLTGMKEARKAFMQQPRAKGLSTVFESRWNAIKQNKVGRPRSKT